MSAYDPTRTSLGCREICPKEIRHGWVVAKQSCARSKGADPTGPANAWVYRNFSRLDWHEGFLRGEISICGARLDWLHGYWLRAARPAPAKRGPDLQ